ncbi:MAG: cytochrome ubiquinol oxidase subunit I [Candidatus Melainabacteria bacterium]|nr:cytochrome ubiquinol oxidase subunit I [Candidatus Melainabacteria bacterium]
MNDLIYARSQMGMSLAFHILFAVAGITLPLMMVIAEWMHLKTRDPIYAEIAKRWATGTAVLFAIGAVSGTVLSFELGLLWPGFMQWAGSIIGLPFSLEGFAFFTEAIFLGIYLYGRKIVTPSMHLFAGIVVAVSGALSAVFVVIANAWMNYPVGFKLQNGMPVEIDPIAAMTSPAAGPQVVHMLIASYAAIGFLAAGVHAYMLLKDKTDQFHRKAMAIALAVGATAAIAEPISGDFIARMVAHTQPVKLAALEGQFDTEDGAPLRIGGVPDVKNRVTPYSIELPKLLSVLAFHDPNARVKGLNDFARDLWPPVLLVHLNFQVMVACGGAMALMSTWAALLYLKTKRVPDHVLFLKCMVLAAPLGCIAVEAGWMVTEFGRQPWVISNILRTHHAATPVPGLLIPFLFFTLVYILLSICVIWLMLRLFSNTNPVTAPVEPAPEGLSDV